MIRAFTMRRALPVALGLAASSAFAGPPANDARDAAGSLSAPGGVSGTTSESTLEAGVTIERFDPFAGWPFARRVPTTIVGGSGSLAFLSTLGHWRARAEYLGAVPRSPAGRGTASTPARTPPGNPEV